jgi:hypothetical protein|tara:strand:- start:1752 stop:1994 length:243 start_codon:yes stop_codon:yes gene_type:complete
MNLPNVGPSYADFRPVVPEQTGGKKATMKNHGRRKSTKGGNVMTQIAVPALFVAANTLVKKGKRKTNRRRSSKRRSSKRR